MRDNRKKEGFIRSFGAAIFHHHPEGVGFEIYILANHCSLEKYKTWAELELLGRGTRPNLRIVLFRLCDNAVAQNYKRTMRDKDRIFYNSTHIGNASNTSL